MDFLSSKVWICVVALVPVVGCGDSGSGSGGSGGDGPSIEAPDQLGSLSVGHTMFTAVDAARDDRSIVLNVWYPVDAADATDGPFTQYPLQAGFNLPSDVAVDDLPVSSNRTRPFLVFSHGFGGINTQSTQLMEALASHGFIVASPEHTGNTALDQSDETPAENRVPDVTFVIDTMFARSNTADDLFEGRIDEALVGVLGHSFGGGTAMGSVAGWAGAEADPRVGAIGVIAGRVGEQNFSEEVLGAVTVPVTFLVGTLDPGARDNHDYAFPRMTSADAAFKVEVIEANHTHFANVCSIGDLLIELGSTQENWPGLGAEALIEPYNATCTDEVFSIDEAHRLQNLYMVAHFKRYLLGQTEYEAFLTSAYAEANEPSVTVIEN